MTIAESVNKRAFFVIDPTMLAYNKRFGKNASTVICISTLSRVKLIVSNESRFTGFYKRYIRIRGNEESKYLKYIKRKGSK